MIDLNKINLNKGEWLTIDNLQYGKTIFATKIGHKNFLIEIEKNCTTFNLQLYRNLKKKRNLFSKYDSMAKLISLTFYNKKHPILDKHFFENMEKIENAYRVIEDFRCAKALRWLHG